MLQAATAFVLSSACAVCVWRLICVKGHAECRLSTTTIGTTHCLPCRAWFQESLRCYTLSRSDACDGGCSGTILLLPLLLFKGDTTLWQQRVTGDRHTRVSLMVCCRLVGRVAAHLQPLFLRQHNTVGLCCPSRCLCVDIIRRNSARHHSQVCWASERDGLRDSGCFVVCCFGVAVAFQHGRTPVC